MRRSLVAANWKMNGHKGFVSQLLDDLLDGLEGSSEVPDNRDIVVCPPSIYIGQVEEKLAGSSIGYGAQNLYTEESGAYTGEISAAMLKDFGCSHVIVGHSERRELFGETDEFVARKFSVACENALIPVLCVGETREQWEKGETEAVILRQLHAVLEHNDISRFGNAVIAYEPVWAIGTGLTASPEQAQEVHGLIRQTLDQRDSTIATQLPILYGGSVKASNAEALFAQPDIDGALVGGASLKSDEFLAICEA